ncbi:restriction endonuclease subunit S [Pediococcus acidilactici]|uniref:restriction endonuclease subunit S n=1 Tax=Pediococcus acidilactici TaxID=1254 RepID=UPI001FB9FC88|nr:restriction endonuclease subunit S [Pediococcus acidilactici]MCJ2192943.1 restriction endonuclease subunit S [Pediococcus acidilactici]
MKDNQAKYPQLRFKGFTDPWEERKLGEHAKYRRGSFPQPYGNKEWYDGEGAMPFVQVVDVTNKLTLVENTKQKISKLAQSKSVFVPKGTVVVTLQGSIGRVAITQYDSFVDRTLLIFEDYEKETDERFWAYTIQKKFEIEKLKAPGGTIKTITKEALSSFDVHLPQFKEQAKIGSFFKQLDDTIALHQCKLAKLKELKQGYLQKLFPRNGSKFPQLRFAGFADAWEQRKLTEIVNRVNKSSNSDVLPKVEFEDIVSGEGRLNKDISSKLDSRKGTLFESENILYGKLRPYLKNWLFPDFEGVALGDFWVFEATDVSVPSFDYYLIQSDDYRKVANDTSGTKMPRSDWKNVSSTDFAIPSKDEQKQIGAFFKQLDDTITLHQRKLEKLQELKKGYLQKMFC